MRFYGDIITGVLLAYVIVAISIGLIAVTLGIAYLVSLLI